MKNDIIDVQTLEEEIVSCPLCGQRNRIHKQNMWVGYRCGACRTDLPNPFIDKRISLKKFSAIGRRLRPYRNSFAKAFFILSVAVFVGYVFSRPSEQATQSLSAKTTQFYSAPPPLPPARTLPNGMLLWGPDVAGQGKLTIENFTIYDAVIEVVDERANNNIVTFYVSAGNTATVEHIRDGNFHVIYTTGQDWDSGAKTFTRYKSCSKFEDSFVFATTRRQDNSGERADWHKEVSLTLHPVVNGNARTLSISENEFLKYLKDVPTNNAVKRD